MGAKKGGGNFPAPLATAEKVWHNREGFCSGIEVVITALTRNQVYPQGYRGFESHPLRQLRNSPYRCASRPERGGKLRRTGNSFAFTREPLCWVRG